MNSSDVPGERGDGSLGKEPTLLSPRIDANNQSEKAASLIAFGSANVVTTKLLPSQDRNRRRPGSDTHGAAKVQPSEVIWVAGWERTHSCQPCVRRSGYLAFPGMVARDGTATSLLRQQQLVAVLPCGRR